MQYAAKTPTEYLDRLETDWRKEKLLEIRKLIKRHGPELKEGLRWGMLTYAGENGGAFDLNAQKNSVNFYVGTARKIDSDGCLLRGSMSAKAASASTNPC